MPLVWGLEGHVSRFFSLGQLEGKLWGMRFFLALNGSIAIKRLLYTSRLRFGGWHIEVFQFGPARRKIVRTEVIYGSFQPDYHPPLNRSVKLVCLCFRFWGSSNVPWQPQENPAMEWNIPQRKSHHKGRPFENLENNTERYEEGLQTSEHNSFSCLASLKMQMPLFLNIL